METITVEISNKRQAAQFAALARNLKYVKSVRLENRNEPPPLTDEDWVRPGRPATDEEMSYFIREYEEEYKTGNFSTLDDVIIGLKSMQNIQEIVQK